METPKTLSPVERLNLINQYKILNSSSPNGNEYDEEIAILTSGYTFSYNRIFQSLEREMPVEEGQETYRFLSMVQAINVSIQALQNSGDTEELPHTLQFNGFDQSNDRHYHYAHHISQFESAFEGLIDSVVNNHDSQRIHTYRDMYKRYDELVKQQKVPRGLLTREQLIFIAGE